MFRADDAGPKGGNAPEMRALSAEQITSTAFTRFCELLADMGWDENDALETLTEEIGQPLQLGEKGFKQWFDRQTIPAWHIFNVSAVFGVEAGWLAGQPSVSKDEAIRPGLYRRELRRRTRHAQAPIKAGRKAVSGPDM